MDSLCPDQGLISKLLNQGTLCVNVPEEGTEMTEQECKEGGFLMPVIIYA